MLATLLIAAQLAGSVAFEGRTEVRVRAPGTGAARASLDLETAPAVRVLIASRRVRATLAYSPRLTLWDVGASAARPTWLNAGSARVEWLSGHARLSLDQAGSYGLLNLAAAPFAAGLDGSPPRAPIVPAPSIFLFASSTTTLGSQLTFGRFMVDTSLGYQPSGGADAGARARLPFQRGPTARATVDRALSRRDRLATTVSASATTFSSGSQIVLAEIDEGYRRLFSRLIEARFAVGASVSRTRAFETATTVFSTYPVAEAVLEYAPRAEGQVGVRLGARLGPVVNPIFGTVDERAGGSIAASHTYRRLTTHAFASGSSSVPSGRANGTQLFAGELGATQRLGLYVDVDAGVRGIWQRQTTTQADFLLGTFFFGVTLRAPLIRP